jgi:hypothetical protein
MHDGDLPPSISKYRIADHANVTPQRVSKRNLIDGHFPPKVKSM